MVGNCSRSCTVPLFPRTGSDRPHAALPLVKPDGRPGQRARGGICICIRRPDCRVSLPGRVWLIDACLHSDMGCLAPPPPLTSPQAGFRRAERGADSVRAVAQGGCHHLGQRKNWRWHNGVYHLGQRGNSLTPERPKKPCLVSPADCADVKSPLSRKKNQFPILGTKR